MKIKRRRSPGGCGRCSCRGRAGTVVGRPMYPTKDIIEATGPTSPRSRPAAWLTLLQRPAPSAGQAKGEPRHPAMGAILSHEIS